MFLKKQTITSKKDGKTYVGYNVQVGEYESPLFFPSKVECLYLDNYIEKVAHKDFKGDDLNVGKD